MDEKELETLVKKLDTYDDLVKKVDTIIETIEALKPKEDAAEKPDPRDKSLAEGVTFLKSYIGKALPQAKLDTMNFDQLLTAAEMKTTLTPQNTLNPAPPISKKDATDMRPSWEIPEVN